jgi:hypothetical protein
VSVGGIGHNAPPLGERLASDYEELAERIAVAVTAAMDTPAVVETEAQNSALGAHVKALRGLAQETEGKRKGEVDPILASQREVNSFFRTLSDKLDRSKEILEARGKRFLDAKAAEERKRREEAARVAREEQEARERAARAAEEAGRVVQAEIELDRAVAAERRASLAEEAAQDGAAELARTRMSGGGLATLRTEWTFEVQDFAKVPLDQLRAFISEDAITKAVRGFVRAGGRQLAGVRIFEASRATYR